MKIGNQEIWNQKMYASSIHSRPWNRGQTLQNIIRKVFCWEIAILEKSTRFDFNVTDRTKLLDQRAKWMERANRLADYK